MALLTGATAWATKPQEGAAAAALDALARAARQVMLYGPRHPIAEQALADACGELVAASAGGGLTIQAGPDGLLWNGAPLGCESNRAGRLHAAMRDRVISSIAIDPGIGPEELGRLLQLLAQDVEELVSGGGVERVLASAPIPGVRVTGVDFTADALIPESTWRELQSAVGPGERDGLRQLISFCERRPASQQPAPSVEGGDRLPGTRVAAAEEGPEGSADQVVAAGMARMIQRAGEESYFTDQERWTAWRREVAQQLRSLSSRWRALIFRAPAGASTEYPDMLGLIAGEMDVEDCVALVLDQADSVTGGRSSMLRLALERIFADRRRRREVEGALHRRAMAMGLSEAVYQNVLGLLISRLDGRQPAREGDAGAQQPADHAPVASPELGDCDIGDMVDTLRPESVRQSRLLMLEDMLGTYLTASNYGTVISLLTRAADECAQRSDVEGLTAVISALGREAGPRAGRDPARRAVAAGGLARASTEQVASCLAQRLHGASEEAAVPAISLLGLLGSPGLRCLVDLVRTGANEHLACAVTTLLERDAPDFSHLHDLLSQARGLSLERALRALIFSEDEELPSKAAVVLAAANEQAQVLAAECIAETGRGDLAPALLPMLDHPLPAVRLAAVKAAAALKLREAVPAICAMVTREADMGSGARVKEAALRALGAIGDAAASPTLCAALLGGTFLSKLAGHRGRAAAAVALAAIGGEEAAAALEQGCRSLHPGVRDACRRAMSRLPGSASGPVERRHVR